jgi:hypothetical protein
MVRTEVEIYSSIDAFFKNEIDSAVLLKRNHPHHQEMLVHEFRKIIKRVRAVNQLIKHSFTPEQFYDLDQELKYAVNSLSLQRDTTVNLRSLLNLNAVSGEKLPDKIRQMAIHELVRQYKRAYSNAGGIFDSRLRLVVYRLFVFRNIFRSLPVSDISPEQVYNALNKSYVKSARLYEDSYYSLHKEVIHKWRKSNKQLFLQLKHSPVEITAAHELIGHIQDLIRILGTEHDYAELENNLSGHPDFSSKDLRTVHRIIDNHRMKLQKKAFDIGNELYSHPVKSFTPQLSFA